MMVSLIKPKEFKEAGESLLKEMEVGDHQIGFTHSILINIRTALQQTKVNGGLNDLYLKLLDAKSSCKEVGDAITASSKHRPRNLAQLEHRLLAFRDLLNEEIDELVLLVVHTQLKHNASLGLNKFKKELQDERNRLNNTKASLQETLNDIHSNQAVLKALEVETEQRVIEKTQRLLEDAQRSIQNRVDDGNETIRATLQSVRDELDIRANRAENKINNLISNAEHKSQIHESDIKELFKTHEKESTNRIEFRIQRAEGIATSLTKQADDAKELYEDITTDQKESLYIFIEDSKKSLNESIRKTSTDASQRVQKAQTDAQDSFNTFLNENITSINERIESKVSEYDALKEKMESTFQDKINTLETQLSIVTSGVMADQHIKQANTERKVYWVFQLTGFVFMLAAIYAGSLFFSELTNVKIPFLPKPDLVIHIDGTLNSGTSPITLMFMRLSMIILLTAPALYLLKEAALHRHKENLYRQRGIQLATISPYLEELEKEERAMIKKELVSSFFNFHDGKADTQNVPDFIRDMKEAVGIAKSLNGQTKTVSQRFNRKEK